MLQTPALPPKIAAAGKEELQKMLIDSLRKLKARDKRLAELKADNEGLVHASTQENGAPNHHVQVACHPQRRPGVRTAAQGWCITLYIAAARGGMTSEVHRALGWGSHGMRSASGA